MYRRCQDLNRGGKAMLKRYVRNIIDYKSKICYQYLTGLYFSMRKKKHNFVFVRPLVISFFLRIQEGNF